MIVTVTVMVQVAEVASEQGEVAKGLNRPLRGRRGSFQEVRKAKQALAVVGGCKRKALLEGVILQKGHKQPGR